MKIITQNAEINSSLSLVQNVFGKKTTMPILNNVLISAKDGKLSILGSNLDIAILVKVPATVVKEGKTTVNGNLFTKICRELPAAEDITLTRGENERLEVITKNSSLRVVGASADEYPNVPGISIATKHKISAALLLEMIEKTVYATSTEEARYNLNGVCFESVTDKKGLSLRLVATDGNRLAMITRPIKGMTTSTMPNHVIVPSRGLQEVRRVLEREAAGDVGIEVSEGFLVIEAPSVKIAVRLIDGEFPDYSMVVPTKSGEPAKMSGALLSQALLRVSLLVSDKGKGVRLDFFKNRLRISGSSPELGEAVEELPIEYAGKDMSIGFNAEYYRDFIATLKEEEEMTIELHDLQGPAKLYGRDESAFSIVMPMRM
jgi:DNA polymerase-3 subunit beta